MSDVGGCEVGGGEREREKERKVRNGLARASMHRVTQVEVREGLGLGLGA
jgi:hypothetical protein